MGAVPIYIHVYKYSIYIFIYTYIIYLFIYKEPKTWGTYKSADKEQEKGRDGTEAREERDKNVIRKSSEHTETETGKACLQKKKEGKVHEKFKKEIGGKIPSSRYFN